MSKILFVAFLFLFIVAGLFFLINHGVDKSFRTLTFKKEITDLFPYVDEEVLLVLDEKAVGVINSVDGKYGAVGIFKGGKVLSAVGNENYIVLGGGDCHGPTCIGKGEIRVFKEEICIAQTIEEAPSENGGGGGGVLDLAIFKEKNLLISGHVGGVINVWNIEDLTKERSFGDRDCEVVDLEVISNAGQLISVNERGVISIWSLETGEKINDLSSESDNRRVIDLKYIDKNEILISSGGYLVSLWDIKSSKEKKRILFSPETRILSSAYYPVNNLLFLSSSDGTIKSVNLYTFEVKEFDMNNNGVYNLTISEDHKYLFSSEGHAVFRVWKIDDFLKEMETVEE